MLRRTVTAFILVAVMAASAVGVSASTILPSGTTEIVPNRLTVRWEDESRDPVTINTFRFFGYNVAQLRSMVAILDGTVADLPDGTYQVGHTGVSAGFIEIDFHHAREVDYIINHTLIRNHEGRLVYPNQPGWVFLPEFEYNWASVRDVINTLGLDLIEVDDYPETGLTEVLVRKPSRPDPGPAVPPPGHTGVWYPPGHSVPTLTLTPNNGVLITSSSAIVATGAALRVSGSSLMAISSTMSEFVNPGDLVVSGNSLSVGFRLGGDARGPIEVDEDGIIFENFPVDARVARVEVDVDSGFVIIRFYDLPIDTPFVDNGFFSVRVVREGVWATLRIEIKSDFTIPPG